MVNDDNLVRVDFHSHTSASHDGRKGWDAEHNRDWHRDGGYDVGYVTDHAAVSEAERGVANNPVPAGNGVTLLQGIEVWWNGEHVTILGAERTYKGLLTPNLHDVDAQTLQLASLIVNREPVVIWDHPRHLNALTAATGPGTVGVRAIELSNGAPNDADHVRRERVAILNLVDQKNLAMTSGSDNHGWGRTAPNWTLMLIPGWRGMSADSLAARIEAVIRKGGSHASRVVERRVAEGVNPMALTFTLVGAPARMFTTLSSNERVSWLLWIWLIEAAIWLVRARRRPRGAD
jgi:predicted metal-dependent phosphoesterase TrpH